MKRWVVLAGLLCGAGLLLAQQGQVQVGNYGVPTTPAACLAAARISQPCTAYAAAFTGLGVSGTTGVQTLYTANAPSGAMFEFCSPSFVSAVGTAGTIALQVTFTTPGGQTRNPSNVGATGSLTATGLQNLGACTGLAVAANSTLSFAVLAVGGTGTPTWETAPVVIRVN